MLQGLISRLTQAGFEPVALPLLRIEPIDIDSAQAAAIRSTLLNLDLFQKVIFISRNAARLGSEMIDHYWPQLPLGVEWIAIGPGTAEVLEEAGINAEINSGVDSEALLASPQLQELAEQRILLVKGVGGRVLLEHTLRQRGARVETIEIYQRVPCRYSDAELAQRFERPIDAVLLTSSESVQAYADLGVTQNSLVVVPSARVARQAETLGFNDVVTASGASDEAMLGALDSRFN